MKTIPTIVGVKAIVKGQLFQGTVSAFCDIPAYSGFSHWTEPFKVRVLWYPFEEWKRKAFVFARNRSIAVKAFARFDPNVRDVCLVGRYQLPQCINPQS